MTLPRIQQRQINSNHDRHKLQSDPTLSFPNNSRESFTHVLPQDIYENLTQPSTEKALSIQTTLITSYCDPRLASLEISYWIDTPIPNEVAAHAISLYLETDHVLVGSFDPELFVSDLITRNRKHCSSLLVVAVLYFAYVSGLTHGVLRSWLINYVADVYDHGGPAR
jgi:hypothetical protein